MISQQALNILKYLAIQIKSNRIDPSRPNTFPSYGEIHHTLKLEKIGRTYGDSLLEQGLRELVEYLHNNGYPIISSIIIDQKKLTPGGDYFRYFGRELDDFDWWQKQVKKVVDYNWGKLLNRIEGVVSARIIYPDDLNLEETHIEGIKKKVLVNKYERDSYGRKKCIEYYGYNCSVCNLLLEDKYGDLAKEFIHVHHIVPISSIGKSYQLDPIQDLRPVCPNCHAILHKRNPPFSIEELRDKLKY
jgi:hypothetical protein